MINVLLIGPEDFKNYFSKEFNVIHYNLSPDFTVGNFCRENNIDVVLQIETLGPRDLIFDIAEVNCLKIFWAIDIHLNYYWHKDYFENFDIILSTQKNFSGEKVIWLPWGIKDEFIADEFKPFKDRKYKISFVGLIDENRLKRKCIIEELKKNFDVYVDGYTLDRFLSAEKMFEIYRNSWIVINESIHRDINFRYFEVTSQGALLYTEKIDNGEFELFKEKEEFYTYNQLNFISRLKYLLKNPEKIEKVAYKGYLKTKNFHKLSDRIKFLETLIKNNLNSVKTKKNNIIIPLFKILIRGIGRKEYSNKKTFLRVALNNLNENYTYLNLIYELINNEKIEALEKLLNLSQGTLKERKNLFREVVKLSQKMSKHIPEYYVGFINVMKPQIILTIFELLYFVYKKYYDEAVRDKNLNYYISKILIKYENYQGAIEFLLNLVREFPENTLFRMMLAKCYFKIYKLDLWESEVLKILLLKKSFDEFIKFKSDYETKIEAILDILKHAKSKKLKRDIIFNLSDFYEPLAEFVD